MSEKAIYTLAFTILISAIIFSGSLVFSASMIANSGFNMGTLTGELVAPPAEESPTPTPEPEPAPSPTPSPTVEVGVGNLAPKGDPDAPVVIIEFSDFQCPYCGRHVTNTIPQLVEEYIDTGKAVYYYRDFPLSFHAEAKPAAVAARCANEQGEFWEYHDILFENSQSLSTDNYKQWAEDLGLDTEQFNSCLDEQKYADDVDADFTAGAQAGVSGTPSFFINGVKLVGAQPFAAFKAAIDAELA